MLATTAGLAHRGRALCCRTSTEFPPVACAAGSARPVRADNREGGRVLNRTGEESAAKPVSGSATVSLDEARALICELGRSFYALGWVSGTGGGISLRVNDRIVMAPSGVQKERLRPQDIFELDASGEVVSTPADTDLRVSACAPLFLHAFNKRNAGAVIHSHSHNALLATLLSDDDTFVVTHLEMMKGLAGVGYHDVHRVPVIENTAHECDLADSLAAAMDREPNAHAVLVRRHGVYIWGDDWVAAKRHAECYDYLFSAAVQLRQRGLHAGAGPQTSTPE